MAIVPGADGCVDSAVYVPTAECCPPRLGEISYCAMACSFIQLLPSGPLWDRPKEEALSRYQNLTDADICVPGECSPSEADAGKSCATLVDHAIYVSNVLMDTLLTALWPTIREANPFTAVTTIDEWLDRLGWEDCYRTACRSAALGQLTPYEVQGACGPLYCPIEIPADLECAIKRALVHSLTRATMGGIKNVCWINWVIAPLGAEISVTDGQGDCRDKIVTISPTSETLPKCPEDLCPVAIDQPQGTVPAMIWPHVDSDTCAIPLGIPLVIWPALLSAECIVRSLLPNNLAKNVRRAC